MRLNTTNVTNARGKGIVKISFAVLAHAGGVVNSVGPGKSFSEPAPVTNGVTQRPELLRLFSLMFADDVRLEVARPEWQY